ncbi:MAG: YebC/PmpR family DNA-binding transcriptional regulator [Bacteroidia bacterium]
MGRIFEKRKHKMFARYDRLAKTFTRYGKEIAIAVKQGGAEPDQNPRLRAVIQNAKGVNMPKERIDAAIKRASSKDSKENYEELVYEGYGPSGVAILIETATDNHTRTVANVRMYFNRSGGSLGKTGSLDFIFTRKGVFTINVEQGVDVEELELELIDFGLEEIEVEGNEAILVTSFEDFAKMQKALEEKKINVVNGELQRIPNPDSMKELSGEAIDAIHELVEKIEQDDDVQAVYHNMKEI